MRPPVDAVTFDFWNTLCYEPPGGYLRGLRLGAMREVLNRAGFICPPKALSDAYDDAWIRYVGCWEANRQYTGLDAAGDIASSLQLAGSLRNEAVDAFCSVGNDADLLTLEGVAGVLAALVDAGVRVGIICDVGFTPSHVLRYHLERHGMLGYFSHWSFSDEVGVYKPDARIFEHALGGLGAPPPDRAAHIGDRRRTDMAGALAAGMRGVRIIEVFDDDDDAQGPGGDAGVSGYDEVLEVLGF